MVELLLRAGLLFPSKPKGSFFLFAELPESYVLSDVCIFAFFTINQASYGNLLLPRPKLRGSSLTSTYF